MKNTAISVEEPVTSRKTSVPMTGKEYLESLNDGREIGYTERK
jgi:hypothetical protein